MKEEAAKRLASAMHEYQKLKEGDPGFDAPPIALSIRRSVAQEFWTTESAEVKAAVLEAADLEHSGNMSEWLELKEVPKTPAQFYQ